VDLLASVAGYNGSSILWLLGSAELDRFVRILDTHNHGQFRKEVQRSVAILGIVGENLAAMPGIYSRVWKCMESVGVQPLTILHGASPNGMVIALPDEPQTLSQTLKQLHTELGLDP
jgi:hypothetical protein